MLTTNLVADGGFPIGINRMLPQRDISLHRHDNVELVVISAGAGRHRVQGGGWPVCRGDVFVIPPGMIHGYDRCRDLQLFNIGYDPIRLALPSARLSALPGFLALVSLEPRLRKEGAFTGHLHLNEASLAAALDAIGELNEEIDQRQPGWQEAAQAILLRLLIRLARGFAAASSTESQRLLRLSQVETHISAHLSQPLSLDELARVAGMSRATLTRAVRALHGTSVRRRIEALRLERARELLAAGELSVAAVASRCGFADSSYFARRFRRSETIGPRSFRKAAEAAQHTDSPHRVAVSKPGGMPGNPLN